MKVKRIYGGSWYPGDRLARCACRYRGTPGDRDHFVGFRCCLFVKINKRKARK